MTDLRLATLGEVAAVQAVEVRAARRFAAVPGLACMAEAPPNERVAIEAAVGEGRVLVASEDGVVIGFALVSRHGDDAHLDEIDVVPEAGGRGVGRALLAAAIAWAEQQGCTAMTLTTFRDVAWNGPFYARAGFVEVGEPLPPRLAAIRAAERARGLDDAPRVAMARPITARG